MDTNNGTKQNEIWPQVKFMFVVDLSDDLKGIAFQEVSGMDSETQVIEYRKSNSPLYSTVKMPGITKYGNITMKRGVFANNATFWNWLKETKMNTFQRRTVVIKLLDEAGKVTMQWELLNAWPTKVTSTDLKSDGNEVAIDTIEIAHEQLIITNGE